MKARIEKKLSKRLVEIAPSLFPDAWRDEEFSELAHDQRTSVSHVLSSCWLTPELSGAARDGTR